MQKTKLGRHWNEMRDEYKLLDFIGEGSYGTVLEAKHRHTKKKVAIKYVEIDPKNNQSLKYILREISVLTHVSRVKNNIYSSKLFDLRTHKNDSDAIVGVFMVLDYMPGDLKKLIRYTNPDNLKQNHILVVLYNMLCGLNFLHSANLIHRDVKPGNILIDDNCNIKFCDFGLSRGTVEKKTRKRSLSPHI
jgi:serine/threonine protein kinase